MTPSLTQCERDVHEGFLRFYAKRGIPPPAISKIPMFTADELENFLMKFSDYDPRALPTWFRHTRQSNADN